jgi:hypothetical protein
MNTTRKHPRTLQEAFGPYTDSRIADTDDRHRVYDLVIAVIAVAVLALIAIGGTI